MNNEKMVICDTEIAAAFQVSTVQVRKWVRRGLLTFVNGNPRQIDARSILKFLDTHWWYERQAYRLFRHAGIDVVVWIGWTGWNHPVKVIQELLWEIFCRDRKTVVIYRIGKAKTEKPSERIHFVNCEPD
ncbi:MAG TPA: hypothetical protein IAA05_03675 [Candidatus Blautia excrementipullorum]|nr:hypothetical protein [Candidatus Blautia excrementipullorum]